MRFTASKKPGNPDTDISRLFLKGVTIIIEEGDKMLLQFPGNDIFIQFLYENIARILVNLNDTIDFTVDVLLEHSFNSHDMAPLYTILKAL